MIDLSSFPPPFLSLTPPPPLSSHPPSAPLFPLFLRPPPILCGGGESNGSVNTLPSSHASSKSKTSSKRCRGLLAMGTGIASVASER